MTDNQLKAKELVDKVIVDVVQNERGALIKVLRKNGVDIGDSIDDQSLLTATYLAFSKSKAFKKDFSAMIKQWVAKNTDTPYSNANGEVWKTIGNAFKDNASKIVETGLGVLSTKLTINAQNKLTASAAELEKQRQASAAAEAQKALAEVAAANAKNAASATKNKWILPLAIIGGVIVIGGIATFFYMKKRKA